MTLNITSSIESQLKKIIDRAIESEKINTDTLRMIIISPNETFDSLKVTYNNSWDEYYYESEYNDAGEIGVISISEWLDIADATFENRKQIDPNYINKAKEYNHKYHKLKPVLSFNHIQEELYKSYLICLREKLLEQINTAICNVAISYSPDVFHHLVGFILHNVVFNRNSNEDNRVIAFNHPNGSGPFYNVRLTLPNFKISYPFLKFYKTGFNLFYPKSNIYEGSEEESNIYTYDIKDFNYSYIKSKRREKAIFRLHDEFEDWNLGGGHIEEEEGDLSEEAFFNAYDTFLEQFPDKVLDVDNIPNPIENETAFQTWLDIIINNNLAITYEHKELIYGYSEEAYKKAIQLFPVTHKSYEGFKKYLSSKFYSQNRYDESLEILNTIKNPSDHEKTHILEILYFLNHKEEFEHIYNGLENKSAKSDVLFIKWLFDIRELNNDSQKILELEKEITVFLDSKINYDTANRARLALMKIYTVLNDDQKATYLFTRLDHPSDHLIQLFLKEFSDVPYLIDAHKSYLSKEQKKKDFATWVEESSLIIPETEKSEVETTPYEDCYYMTHKIKDVNLQWAVPIHNDKFVAVNDDKQLYLGEITSSYEVTKHDSLQLDKDNTYKFFYENEIIYVADYNNGITQYRIQENAIIKLEGVIKNQNVLSKYKSITVSDGHLYACNNEYLEIFDLSTKELISSELFIDSGFSLHVYQNILVVEPSSRLLVLIDINDKSNPTYVSSIKDNHTYSNNHIAFIDNYLIGGTIIEISNPKSPKYICHTRDEVAPIYYFSEKPKVPLYSTGGEYLFKTISEDHNNISSINWLESINKENLYYEPLTSNLATIYDNDTVIGFTPYNICILKKGKNPKFKKQQFDIQPILKKMSSECFEYLVNNHPDFKLGKIVFEHKPDYGVISLSFQECSSFVNNINIFDEPKLPVIQSNFSIYSYFRDVEDVDYDTLTMEMQFDLHPIVEELIIDPRFDNIASKYVAVIVNNESRYLHYPNNIWKPYREQIISKDPETVENILLSENDNLLKKLSKRMASEQNIPDELIRILNLKPGKEQAKLNSKVISNESIQKSKATYIRGPLFNKTEKEESLDIKKLKKEAFRVLSSHPDRKFFRDIIFNGAKYGIPKPVLSEIPDQPNIKPAYISILVNNWYGLWDEFSEDPKIKPFLISVIDKIEDTHLKIKLAYRYELYTHASIQEYIQNLLTDKYYILDYHHYIGDDSNGSVNISKLPVDVIKPFEEQLLQLHQQYKTEIDEDQKYRINNMITPICGMLNKLGHEVFPEKLMSKVESERRYLEEYEDNMFGEDLDDYESENAFLLKLYRSQKVNQILKSFETDKENPVWNNNISPEPYKKSWYKTIDQLIDKGTEIYGDDFKNIFISRLSTNIPKDDNYENDRLIAYNFINYTYKRIQKKPELASLAEILVTTINQNKDKFSQDIDLYKIKEKSKYALLQAAWNDLKNKEWDLAEQKGDAIIQMDSQFGQVYFLKARLLWLKEGIPAYLDREQEFIDKASHDAAALARLYNLTGCALDIQKKYKEALPYFKNAALTATNEPMYLANIAEIYYKLKNPKEALNYVKKAKQNGQASEMIDEIIKNKGIINPKEHEDNN
ncbi:hypothetical protein [Aquimarina sp. 2201CG5-10]|uniref:hypothetical protein n=1 Tax=Aquimarina callyspongiae TaxID=3098150 RepID=UPI002AB43D24|nr:hypothetical protein [Aquimarina sp. 2201CG5-10]MDY8138530.1 hypothetical protein [Aquimarina sp. 2201CG5-10]